MIKQRNISISEEGDTSFSILIVYCMDSKLAEAWVYLIHISINIKPDNDSILNLVQ